MKNQMSREPDNLPNTVEAAQNEGLEPEIVDPPLGDLFDDEAPVPELDIEQMSRRELFDAVMKRGAIIFNKGQGRMLSKCPAYRIPAVCPMHPEPDPVNQNPTLVCKGPNIAKDTKGGLIRPQETYYRPKPCHRNCPYSRERLNEFRMEALRRDKEDDFVDYL